MSLMQSIKPEISDIRNFLYTLLDNINASVVILDENLRIKAFNKSFEHNLSNQLFPNKNIGNAINCIYAITNDDLCGKMPQCELCDLRNSLKEVIISKQNTKNQYFNRTTRINGDSIERTFLFSAHPVKYQEEDMIMLIIEDITNQQKQKERLEKQNFDLVAINEQKNRFLSIASHDLRNPIATMQACSSLLMKALNDKLEDDQKDLLDIIFTKSQYSLQLISDLLDYSKIEAGKLNLYLQDENFNSFFNYLLNNYTIMFRQNNLMLKANIADGLPAIKMDRNRIEQVINNLVDNAIKYSKSDDTITIECAAIDNYLVFSVQDCGPGIPNDELTKIFNAFHKVETTFHSRRNGSGLGLAIVKKIIDAHDGKVEVESELEKGSKFTIKLPIT